MMKFNERLPTMRAHLMEGQAVCNCHVDHRESLNTITSIPTFAVVKAQTGECILVGIAANKFVPVKLQHQGR